MSMSSLLQHESRTTGINLNTASPREMIVVFKRTIEALRRLPDEVDLRQITKGAIDVIEADLRTIISGIDAMDYRNRDIYELLASRDAVLDSLRQSRNELFAASHALDQSFTEANRRSFYNYLIKFQERLSMAIAYFE